MIINVNLKQITSDLKPIFSFFYKPINKFMLATYTRILIVYMSMLSCAMRERERMCKNSTFRGRVAITQNHHGTDKSTKGGKSSEENRKSREDGTSWR